MARFIDPHRGRRLGAARDRAIADMAREQAATDLEAAGWPSVAEDVREGISADVILRRLREIGEEHSTATDIVSTIEED